MEASRTKMQTYAEALEQKYRFFDNPDVQEFLKQNGHLASLLLDAWDRIAGNFGPDTSVVLEVRAQSPSVRLGCPLGSQRARAEVFSAISLRLCGEDFGPLDTIEIPAR
jgi:hypothetical protein